MAETYAILVVTATPGFGDLIQQTLEETGLYKVLLVDGTAEALQCAQTMRFALGILDTVLRDGKLEDLASGLKKLLPGLRLIIVPPENEPKNVDLDVPVQAYLSKPFYLPDLLKTVSEVLSRPVSPSEPTRPALVSTPSSSLSALPWLEDVSLAAQHLTRLSLESAAQAALILRAGQMWAYAGELSQPVSQELARLVARFWEHDRQADAASARKPKPGGDMVRFVRLETNGGDYLLYATPLGREMILALAFDAETPFSKIRSQAGNLARALASPGSVSGMPASLGARATSQTSTSSAPEAHSSARPLLEDVPPPVPSHKPSPPSAAQVAAASTIPSGSPTAVNPPAETAITQQEDKTLPPAEPSILPAAPSAALPEVELVSEQVDKAILEETSEETELHPPTPTLAGLYYACLLIPRLPQHFLVGDLAKRLEEWVGQICLAFGWRLEHLTVRAEYLQWIVNVPPTVSPSYLMRVIRQHTSERIFGEFTSLVRENPSGDFWAPGYLIMSSRQPPSEHLIRHFIEQTRHHQTTPKGNNRLMP